MFFLNGGPLAVQGFFFSGPPTLYERPILTANQPGGHGAKLWWTATKLVSEPELGVKPVTMDNSLIECLCLGPNGSNLCFLSLFPF